MTAGHHDPAPERLRERAGGRETDAPGATGDQDGVAGPRRGRARRRGVPGRAAREHVAPPVPVAHLEVLGLRQLPGHRLRDHLRLGAVDVHHHDPGGRQLTGQALGEPRPDPAERLRDRTRAVPAQTAQVGDGQVHVASEAPLGRPARVRGLHGTGGAGERRPPPRVPGRVRRARHVEVDDPVPAVPAQLPSGRVRHRVRPTPFQRRADGVGQLRRLADQQQPPPGERPRGARKGARRLHGFPDEPADAPHERVGVEGRQMRPERGPPCPGRRRLGCGGHRCRSSAVTLMPSLGNSVM